ncbi:MAG: PTS sugar transporter subunit IIA, partial [Dysgonomonas sp.]
GKLDFLKHYYSTNLFFSNVEFKNKAEVLQFMCDKAKSFHDLPQNFYDYVLEREERGQTDFGNLVAIPHPSKLISKSDFVVVTILNKPIFGGHYDVQRVLLVVLAQNPEKNVERFYEMTTDFVFNEEKVRQLISMPVYTHFYDLLCGNQTS